MAAEYEQGPCGTGVEECKYVGSANLTDERAREIFARYGDRVCLNRSYISEVQLTGLAGPGSRTFDENNDPLPLPPEPNWDEIANLPDESWTGRAVYYQTPTESVSYLIRYYDIRILAEGEYEEACNGQSGTGGTPAIESMGFTANCPDAPGETVWCQRWEWSTFRATRADLYVISDESVICPDNSHVADGRCVADDGYEWFEPCEKFVETYVPGEAISITTEDETLCAKYQTFTISRDNNKTDKQIGIYLSYAGSTVEIINGPTYVIMQSYEDSIEIEVEIVPTETGTLKIELETVYL